MNPTSRVAGVSGGLRNRLITLQSGVAHALHEGAGIMKTRSLSVFSALALSALIGCTSGDVSVPGDDGDGSGSGSDGGDGPVPTTPEGKFAVTSDFDLATNAPGTAGQVARYFIDATNDPDDPTRFIVTQLINALPDGTIKNVVSNAAPFVTGYLNDRLLEIAPDLLTKIIEAGDKVGQITKHFGTVEVLDVKAGGIATKTVTGLHFTLDNVPLDFAFADFNLPNTTVENVQVTLEQTGKLTIAQHTVPLKYGQVLKLAIDQAVIPFIDPSATNIGDLLHHFVDCQAVGQFVFEAIGFGSPSTFESACNSGLTAAGTAVYRLLDQIDGAALEFAMTGVARGVDKNSDGKMDDINAGTWTGTLGYAGTPAPLGDAKFFGKKAQ